MAEILRYGHIDTVEILNTESLESLGRKIDQKAKEIESIFNEINVSPAPGEAIDPKWGSRRFSIEINPDAMNIKGVEKALNAIREKLLSFNEMRADEQQLIADEQVHNLTREQLNPWE